MTKAATGALKYYRPTTPSRRGKRSVSHRGLHPGSSFGPLTRRINKTGMRNNTGRITTYGRGGKNQHRRMYRKIDFSRKLMDTWGEVERIEYDPNRSAFIALIKYKPNSEILAEIIKGKNSWSSYYCNVKNGIVYAYILATKNMRVGDRVISCEYFSVDHPEGSCLPLAYIPIGKFVHNIQTSPGSKNFFVRGAGCAAIIVGKAGGYVNVKLPSGTTMRIQDSCKATMGCVSNENHNQIKLGSAGANRRRGRKPTVRGHAMNPVDHKMGGRKSGQIIQTNWRGHMKKGQKTRRKKKSSDHIISGRRKRNA